MKTDLRMSFPRAQSTHSQCFEKEFQKTDVDLSSGNQYFIVRHIMMRCYNDAKPLVSSHRFIGWKNSVPKMMSFDGAVIES